LFVFLFVLPLRISLYFVVIIQPMAGVLK